MSDDWTTTTHSGPSTTVYYIHPVKASGLYDSTSVNGRTREAIAALEESRIVWGRDWDALAVGWFLGVLMTLALFGLAGLAR